MSLTILRRHTVTTAQPGLPDQRPTTVPPAWTPGICHHDAHTTWRGVRYGLLFLPDDLASVLPCLHNSKTEAQP